MDAELTKKTPKKSSKASKPVEGFPCTFCGKVLKYEKSLMKHACRLRKRYLDRDRKPNRYAYMAYRRFYELQRMKIPTVEHFENSKVYDAFVRFGKFIIDQNVISPDDFITYVISSNVGVDRWCSPTLYNEYVVALTKLESWDRAIERNLLLMEQWAMQDPNRRVIDFFREISGPLAVQYVTSGRISPWALLLCQSGQELLERLDAEQINLVYKTINFKFWKQKFAGNPKSVEAAQSFLAEEGL